VKLENPFYRVTDYTCDLNAPIGWLLPVITVSVRPFAEVREFNFNVRLKNQNGHLNQTRLMLAMVNQRPIFACQSASKFCQFLEPNERSTFSSLRNRQLI